MSVHWRTLTTTASGRPQSTAIDSFPLRKVLRRGRSQHTNPAQAAQVILGKVQVQRRNARSDTCNPVFHPSFDLVHNVSAFNNCHKPQQRGSVGNTRRICFLKKLFHEKFATWTPSDFYYTWLHYLDQFWYDWQSILRNLEVQHYPRKQNVGFFMPPLNKLKLINFIPGKPQVYKNTKKN